MLLTLTDKEMKLLAVLTTHAIIDAGALLKPLDEKKEPARYSSARDDFDTLCTIHALLTEEPRPTQDAISDLQRWRGRNGNALADIAYDEAARNGVDPHAELFAIDPRANDPRCIHGIAFKDPCDACSTPGEAAA